MGLGNTLMINSVTFYHVVRYNSLSRQPHTGCISCHARYSIDKQTYLRAQEHFNVSGLNYDRIFLFLLTNMLLRQKHTTAVTVTNM